MEIIGVFFLFAQSYFAFFKPKLFLFFYLMFISSFLGLIPKVILIGGVDIGLFHHSALMILISMIYFKRILSLKSYVKLLSFLVFLFYLYGIIKPVWIGESSFFQSLIASKEFSTLFLVPYLFIFQNSFSINYIFKVLSFFGYYFLFILLLYVLLDFTPSQYTKDGGQLEFYYPSILSLFLFMKSAQAKNILEIVFVLFILTIWVVGMYYEGHLAIMLTTFVGCIIVLFKLPIINFVNKKSWILFGIGLLILLSFNSFFIELSKLFFESSSILSRNLVNVGRIELISERPLLGYGFMHDSALQIDSINIYAKNLFVIDSGYIDLLGKFGFIGALSYLILLTTPFLKKEKNIMKISLKLFFLQLLLVNITWSVFSFSIGTIAISIALFLFHSYQNIQQSRL